MRSPSNKKTIFEEALKKLPPPGTGLHTQLLGVANRGAAAGLSEQAIFDAIRRSIPTEGRKVPDGEILATVQKALHERSLKSSFRTGQRQEARKFQIDGRSAFLSVLSRGTCETFEDIGMLSPVAVPEDNVRQGLLLLESQYAGGDKIYIGDTFSGIENIKTRDEWCSSLAKSSTIPFEQIILNPLTGHMGKTKDEKDSFRADSCVASYRFALGEFDNLPLPEQIRFWSGAIDMGLPVAALIFTGGKSIHSWLRVDCKDVEEWESKVEQLLFEQFFVPMGVDPACRNESRLSRMPGAFRKDKGAYQQLIYLNKHTEVKR